MDDPRIGGREVDTKEWWVWGRMKAAAPELGEKEAKVLDLFFRGAEPGILRRRLIPCFRNNLCNVDGDDFFEPRMERSEEIGSLERKTGLRGPLDTTRPASRN